MTYIVSGGAYSLTRFQAPAKDSFVCKVHISGVFRRGAIQIYTLTLTLTLCHFNSMHQWQFLPIENMPRGYGGYATIVPILIESTLKIKIG